MKTKRIIAAVAASVMIGSLLSSCTASKSESETSFGSSNKSSSLSEPETSESVESKPDNANTDSVTIKGETYDIATTELDLHDSEITDEDVKQIGKLTNLTDLDLRNNQISDISPLAGLTNLTELRLYNNQISDSDQKWLREKLPDCLFVFD